ncbi:hypothetical protein D3C78_1521850 [compost metagenome]
MKLILERSGMFDDRVPSCHQLPDSPVNVLWIRIRQVIESCKQNFGNAERIPTVALLGRCITHTFIVGKSGINFFDNLFLLDKVNG